MVQCLTVLSHEPLCSMDLCYFFYESVLVTVVLSSLLYNHVWFFFLIVKLKLGGVEHETDPFVSEGMLKVTEHIEKLYLKFEIKEHNNVEG